MGRAMRILLALLGGAALLALTLGALLMALSLGFQRERLRLAIEATLSRTLGTEVALGALEGRLVPDLALRDVRVGPADDPQIELDRLVVRLGSYAPTPPRGVVRGAGRPLDVRTGACEPAERRAVGGIGGTGSRLVATRRGRARRAARDRSPGGVG